MPIKGQRKTTKDENLPVLPQEQYLLGKRIWTDVEPGEYSLSDHEVSKKLIRLLRNGSLPREDDGAIELWRNKRWSSETFPALSSLVWRQMEEKHGRRRKQEKIPVLNWFIRSHLAPVSSSGSFRTQSHWSHFTGQCCYSGQILPIHLSCRMCNQFTFHHQFGIDTWRSKFEQQTDSILSACGSHGQETIRILIRSTWEHRVLHNTCIKKAWKKHQNTVYCVDIKLAQKKDWSSIRRDRTLSFFTKHSQLLVSRKLLRWKLEKSYTRKYMRHLGLLQDLFETWLDERIGFRSCSTTRWTSCAAVSNFPIGPTKSKPRSW